MATATALQATGVAQRVTLVDADVHPMPRSPEQLRAYLPEPWRSRPSQLFGEPKVYQPWDGAFRGDARGPAGEPPCSDPDFTQKQLLDAFGVDYAMLLPIVKPYANPNLEAALDIATNAWMADTWLGSYNAHERYRGAINVCADLPVAAVQEIETWGAHPLFSQIRINTYTKEAFGDERYHAIYEAACRHDLPVAVHFTKSSGVDLATPVGFQRSYFELHSLLSLNYAAHLTSLIFEGVFEKFPRLRFVFVEGGFSWLLPLMRRLDNAWRALRAEIPWVKRPPSYYIAENTRYTTQPIEEPDDLRQLFRVYELLQADKILMFSTDYPHWDFDAPTQATFRRMPPKTREAIFCGTAVELYRLPTTRSHSASVKE